MNDLPEILTMQQAAEYLQVSVRTLQRMVATGEVPGRQVGRQWRFDQAQLREWVRGEGIAAATEQAQRELMEKEAARFGLDQPETLVELQRAALRRQSRKD